MAAGHKPIHQSSNAWKIILALSILYLLILTLTALASYLTGEFLPLSSWN